VARVPLLYQFAKVATPDLTPTAREVLGVHLAHGGLHDGRDSHPSASTVAGILGYSESTTRKARALLIDRRYLIPDGLSPVPIVDGAARPDLRTRNFTARVTPIGVLPVTPRYTERGVTEGQNGVSLMTPKAVPAPIKHLSDGQRARGARSSGQKRGNGKKRIEHAESKMPDRAEQARILAKFEARTAAKHAASTTPPLHTNH
jgi:hypothetical protein